MTILGRIGVVFRCLLVLAIGITCFSYILQGLCETDGDGILIAFFVLCVYAGVVCGAMGRDSYFAMMLSIRDLGCIGMAFWAFSVTLLSFILIPIILSINIFMLMLQLSLASFSFIRNSFLRYAFGIFFGVAMIGGVSYVSYHYIEKYIIVKLKENDSGQTALHKAVMANNVDEVKRLIAQGANVNQQDKLGNTPLHLAAFLGRTDCVVALLNAPNIDLSIKNKQNKTPLDMANDGGNHRCYSEIERKLNAQNCSYSSRYLY
mgnify:CR=1 FL=1